mmetsp:Transcript_15721/g.21595  ORF Transcript_15721/g.21595 Transcript_15721/m.21595 type:complete len:487 (+) Transcript_15721:50-1510(+)
MQHMNSGMSNMNSTESSGATFSSWDSYRLRLLFSSWDITKPWQFALTFFAVMLAVVFYHFLECVTGCFEKGMILYLHEIQVAAPVDSESSDLTKLPTIVYSRPKGWATVKILYGLLCACKFALTLFLMLIAMTLNPSLFLALFVGYLLGDFLFCDYKLNVLMGGHHPLQDHGGIVRKLLQMSLCVNSSQQSHEANELLEAHKVTSTDQMMPIVAVGTLWVLPRVFSLIYLVVLLVWIVETQGGFGFDASTVFGWHALLMSFFVTLFTNEAVLTYTAPLFPQLANHVKYLKSFHSLCHILSLTSLILGLVAIVSYKQLNPAEFPFFTMYSPHSWLGVCTVALWGCQLLFSLWLFVLTTWPVGSTTKQGLLALHHFLGHVCFAMGLATCATGLQGMQSSDLAESSSSSSSSMTSTDFSNSTMTDMGGDMGYGPHSTKAQLASAASILLLAIGISTFAALKFLPRQTKKSIPPADQYQPASESELLHEA